jgi:uncharacterized membrane protein YraQ (UPF0718 family)
MQRSIQEQIEDFNKEVHAFEKERQFALDATISIIQSLDLKGLKKYTDHLHANLNGIVEATSLEELELYKNSFNEVLDSLVIDRDVLQIFPCLLHFRNVIDLSNASFEADHKQDEKSQDIKRNSRLEWIRIGLTEFLKNAEELRLGLEERLYALTKTNAAQNEIENVKSAIIKVKRLEDEMKEMPKLAQEMLLAENRMDFDNKRRVLAERLRNIQSLGGASESGKDLQNHFINIGRRHVEALCEARSSYLPGASSVPRKAIDFGWIVLGAAVTLVGAVLVAPVAVVVLGVASMAYGAVDLSKELAEPISEHNMPKLGKRKIDKPPQTGKEKAKSIFKKALPVVLSGLALAAGITSFLVPPITIAMAVIGLCLALAGGIMLGVNWYQEKKKSKQMMAKHAAIQNKYMKPSRRGGRKKPAISPEEKEEKTEDKEMTQTLVQPTSSEAKIDLFLLGHQLDETISPEEKERLRQRKMTEEETPSASEKKTPGPEPVKESAAEKASEKKSDEDKPDDEGFHLHH